MKRLILLLILLLMTVSYIFAQGASGRTLDSLNLRTEPSISGNIITQIPIGAPINVQGRTGDDAWLFVTGNDETGWVSSWYVELDDVVLTDIPIIGVTQPTTTVAQPQTSFTGDVLNITAKTRLNIRLNPSISSTIIGALADNQTVTGFGRTVDGSWVAVDTGTVQGWVFSPFVFVDGDIETLSVRYELPNPPMSPETDTTEVVQTRTISDGEYVITGPAPDNSTSYDIEFTLHWNTTANLDLRVTGPDGYQIVPGILPSPTGGYFQQPVGANENCITAEGAALEVITWNKGTAPSGLYQIEAEYVNSCFSEREEDTLFWVSVKNDGPEVEFWVSFIEPGELFEYEFTRP